MESPDHYAPARPRFPWIPALIVGGAVVVACGILAVVALLQAGTETDLTFRDIDRQIVVTATDLEPFLPELVFRIDGELVSRTKLSDGQVRIRYQYEHPDSTNRLIIDSLAVFDGDEIAAQATYLQLVKEAKQQIAQLPVDVTFVEQADQFAAGNETLFGALQVGGKARGGLLVCRQGPRVARIIVYGDQFEADGLPTVAGDVMAALSVHQP